MSRKNWTTEKLFFRFLTNKSEIVYWDNLRELRLRGGEDIFLRSYTLAKSDLTKEQVIGIDILAQLGAPSKEFTNKTLDLFFEILKIATNPDVLTSLLFGIGHNNNALNEEQIALIATFKTHENTEIRQGVVHALLAVDNDTAIKTLISLTSDKVDSIRDWATFGIGTQSKRSNKEILDALWLRVKDRNANTKYEAIVGLANRNV